MSTYSSTHRSTTLVVANLKGGVGKTTTAVHLAAGLGRHSAAVLVDADPQQSAARWVQLAGADIPFQLLSAPSPRLRGALEAGPAVPYTVIDTPPGDTAIVAAALALADVVLLPVAPLLMDLDRLAPTLDLLAAAAAAYNPTVWVLLTRVRSGTRSAGATRDWFAQRQLPVLSTEIPLAEAYGWSYGAVPPDGHRYGAVIDELLAPGVPTRR